jgi:hypothetical protein
MSEIFETAGVHAGARLRIFKGEYFSTVTSGYWRAARNRLFRLLITRNRALRAPPLPGHRGFADPSGDIIYI